MIVEHFHVFNWFFTSYQLEFSASLKLLADSTRINPKWNYHPQTRFRTEYQATIKAASISVSEKKYKNWETKTFLLNSLITFQAFSKGQD